MILKVPGTKVMWKCDKDGPQVSDDGGETWRFTFRGKDEWMEMWPTAIVIEGESTPDTEESDREVFGETLDDPIPDDLWEMLNSL